MIFYAEIVTLDVLTRPAQVGVLDENEIKILFAYHAVNLFQISISGFKIHFRKPTTNKR